MGRGGEVVEGGGSVVDRAGGGGRGRRGREGEKGRGWREFVFSVPTFI